jgi:hypothetical protein
LLHFLKVIINATLPVALFTYYYLSLHGAKGRGYTGARTDTTQQSGQTPDREVDTNHITVYVSGYTETDTNGMSSPYNDRLSGANKVGLCRADSLARYLLQCA